MKLKFTLSALFVALFSFASFAITIEPDSVKINKRLWLYFGWQEDHPKAISVMGGALYSRRPQLPAQDGHSWYFSKEAWHSDSNKPLFFMLSVDGSAPFYPDEFSPTRRTDIHWHLAEGSLPFPVSCWEYNGVKMQITHLGRRILDNSVNAVYTQVVITNTDEKPHEVSLQVVGESAPERCFFLHKAKYTSEQKAIITDAVSLKPGKSKTFELVSPANGKAEKEAILASGSFKENYQAEKEAILSRMDNLTMPVALPDERFIDMWKASMTYMWNATVKTNDDYEQRGSGGNIHGFYQYDRPFDHDVPDMAIQYIIEGDTNAGNYIIDIPYCVDNIANVKVEGGNLISIDSSKGKAIVTGNSTKITLALNK